MNRRRSLVAVAALSLTVLSACGASAPPARELADEMIDTLTFGLDPVADEELIERRRECMHRELDEFSLTPEEAAGFEDLDDVAAKADGGNELALQVMDRFEESLASCR